MRVDRVDAAASLPCREAAVDLVETWIGIADESRRLFAEQCVVEAERGDIEAALYADSARMFCEVSIENLRMIRSAIIGIASTATSIALGVLMV